MPPNKKQRVTVIFFIGVAPNGVYTARYVTISAVGSYPAFSSLPINIGGYFLLHFP